MPSQEVLLLKQLSQCWNDFDATHLAPYLADDVIYESQWVFQSLIGKSAFMDYFLPKMEVLKETVKTEGNSISAKVIFLRRISSKPFILLKQILDGETYVVYVFITTEEDKIKRIDLCAYLHSGLTRFTSRREPHK